MKLNEVFELETPEHVASLATSGMLVSTDVNVWSATKQDRSISDGVCKDKRASDKAGRFVKNLLVNFPEHKAIGTYRSTIYNWQVRKTFQWSKGQNYIFAIVPVNISNFSVANISELMYKTKMSLKMI